MEIHFNVICSSRSLTKSRSFPKAPLPLAFAGISSASSLLCCVGCVMALRGVVAALLLLTSTGISSLSSVFRGSAVLRGEAAPLASGFDDEEVRVEGGTLAGSA